VSPSDEVREALDWALWAKEIAEDKRLLAHWDLDLDEFDQREQEAYERERFYDGDRDFSEGNE
jgi:hypothetical protein